MFLSLLGTLHSFPLEHIPVIWLFKGPVRFSSLIGTQSFHEFFALLSESARGKAYMETAFIVFNVGVPTSSVWVVIRDLGPLVGVARLNFKMVF